MREGPPGRRAERRDTGPGVLGEQGRHVGPSLLGTRGVAEDGLTPATHGSARVSLELRSPRPRPLARRRWPLVTQPEWRRDRGLPAVTGRSPVSALQAEVEPADPCDECGGGVKLGVFRWLPGTHACFSCYWSFTWLQDAD